jgi:hypothetical protein
MTRVRKVLTFSNVVAFIALFIALGGSVYAAGKISGSQIQAGSLPGNRIKTKSLTAKQVKTATLTGRQIKPESLGTKQINESTLTGVSASSISLVQYVTTTVPLSGSAPAGNQGTASCPPNTNVIGGGASVSNAAFAFVDESGPNATRNGWTATAFGEDGTSMTVTAICTAVNAIG